ncbi:2-succinyl-5-enolpyruvyl-6-hydroxy-3-cyclohexene-1-carboxylic-acid synthase [Flavobacterium urocaniciphilum]|uniref:2-succinyl-5-enolpyruvyl-6-hydroxy-3-cyclohexene-1-carboxylate synthase n=1 Tax=Flavobacterium urocaniciphilum TaxID=1299341 RepID=A0A1H9B6V0_9FLAO|nr:2-succinyl-5-enolpyruvyl-6-hydroxy-3-cyclohexene-1-carboxylic-acid synthase [Flavobacterium urocaniciphilum]SEP84447.1 2-succinyl-5-enolpyruvyl-6-hydroxy-3-cyclohexene-1-carboxylate synthase [Flavobacterium urocaniciphilum]
MKAKLYPKIQLAQAVIELFLQKEIQHIVISPGSRNAPLTIGFTNHEFFKCYSIADERCAAFFALGLAQQLQKPVAVVCTSGSALLNYYPAVAEAFYSQIPLLVVSADRPQSKIDIGDGQTIRQENVYANHIVFSSNLTEEASKENDNLIVKAIDLAISEKGPAHINVPFEEPLYETLSEATYFPEISVRNANKPDFKLDSKFISEWNAASKKLVLVGELAPNSIEEQYIELLANNDAVVVLTEKTSNLHHSSFIDRIDTLITSFTEEDFKNFQPDILLTFGGMVVSKRIKAFLRNYKPKHHWHVDTHRAYDTYNALTQHFQTDCNGFFSQLQVENNVVSQYKNYITSIWENRNAKHNEYVTNIPFSDFKVFDFLSQHLPSNVQLQVSNSSPIRYIQLVDIDDSIEVFCNRGTSGIDGSTSTAIGAALVNKKPTILITGDISFLYDSNALWNNYIPATFKIILINNNGGGIFRILPGHQENETFNTFFETSHHLTAEHLAKMYQIDYHTAKDEKELENAWKSFVSNNTKPAILEVFTPEKLNNTILLDYFKNL